MRWICLVLAYRALYLLSGLDAWLCLSGETGTLFGCLCVGCRCPECYNSTYNATSTADAQSDLDRLGLNGINRPKAASPQSGEM